MAKKIKRKFFKTIVEVQVLSEDFPIEFDNLLELHHMTNSGEHSGVFNVKSTKRLNGLQAAKALISQGSDPEFFRINEKGENLDE